jgi:hypothetical protein
MCSEFIKKYNEIKSDTWPDIANEEDFDNLPEEIKKECKEVFSFPHEIIIRCGQGKTD